MSYYRNNIPECVPQGDYGCDSDAVDVSCRLGITAVLQQLKNNYPGIKLIVSLA